MNYKKIYDELINKRRNFPLKKDAFNKGTIECHHIIPKSLGGSNDKDNLIILTTREHYIAHLLLVKIHEASLLSGSDKTPYYKMLSALTAMMNMWGLIDKIQCCRINKFNSKLYSAITIELRRYYSLKNKERFANLTDTERKELGIKISNGLKKYIYEHGSIWTGRKHSAETKRKMSEIAIARPFTKKCPSFGKKWIFNIITGENKLVEKDFIIDGDWRNGRCFDAKEYREKENLIKTILEKNKDANVKISFSIKTLQKILFNIENQENILIKKKELEKRHFEEKTAYYKMLFSEYLKNGYSGVVEKYGYDKSRVSLVNQFHRYIPEYVPDKRRIHVKVNL